MSVKQPKTNCPEHTNISAKQSIGSDISLDNVANHLAKDPHEAREKLFSMEKSTLILIIIVSLFIVTHSTRMASKMYMTIFPQFNTEENFIRCLQLNRYFLCSENHSYSLLILKLNFSSLPYLTKKYDNIIEISISDIMFLLHSTYYLI